MSYCTLYVHINKQDLGTGLYTCEDCNMINTVGTTLTLGAPSM